MRPMPRPAPRMTSPAPSAAPRFMKPPGVALRTLAACSAVISDGTAAAVADLVRANGGAATTSSAKQIIVNLQNFVMGKLSFLECYEICSEANLLISADARPCQ